jgi:hypothetical protein
MRFTSSSSLAVALALVASSRLAAAQTPPSIDTRTFRPSTDPSAGLVLESATTPGPWAWNVGAWVDYAYRPTYGLEHSVNMDLVASLGLGRRVAIGLDLPTALLQVPQSWATAPSSAIGDLGLHAKWNLVDDAQGGFGLAAIGDVALPTGDPGSYLGEGSVTAGARVLAEYSLVVASLQASAGYRARAEHEDWPPGVRHADVVPWSIGASLRPDVLKIDPGHRQRWDLALHGEVGGRYAGNGDGVGFLSLSDRVELGHYRDAYVVLGAELGAGTNAPYVRGVVALGWAPRDHDMDHDGVPDDVDQCPELPEDKDGFEDRDGCPELDNDDDGILDKEDACPDVPGVPSDDPHQNGCPQPDRDKDGVPDAVDACPDEKGVETSDPKTNGCPMSKDRDGDGIPDAKDKCPDQPEDKDGFQDDDGCPDPDDDGDGIGDAQDACPREPGEPSTDPKINGCPNPDRDGDTYDNKDDKCPDEPETFNGVKDDDGCPDEGGRPLVTIAETKGAPRFVAARNDPLAIDGTTLRAIALELNRHRNWMVLVATSLVTPPSFDGDGEGGDAAGRAVKLALTLNGLTHRIVTEITEWASVSRAPMTAPNTKLVIVVGGTKRETPLSPAGPQ